MLIQSKQCEQHLNFVSSHFGLVYSSALPYEVLSNQTNSETVSQKKKNPFSLDSVIFTLLSHCQNAGITLLSGCYRPIDHLGLPNVIRPPDQMLHVNPGIYNMSASIYLPSHDESRKPPDVFVHLALHVQRQQAC